MASSLKQIITRNERLEVLRMEWSRKMDLVAIVNEKSELEYAEFAIFIDLFVFF